MTPPLPSPPMMAPVRFISGDYVDFADSSRGVVATVGACDVAERTRRAEVADGGSRSVGEDIVGHGDESVFFNEHSSVFHDDGETVDVGVDDKTYIGASLAHQVGDLGEVFGYRLGVWANLPVASQLSSMMFLTPRARSNWG